jgi:alginate O-acetyltransferase complex protein AlgJ
MSTRQIQSIHAWLFTAIVLVVCVLALHRARTFEPPAVSQELIDGRLAHAFESHYDEAFPVRDFAIGLWAALDYTLFGEARSGAIVGKDGWLYTDEEFKVDDDAQVQLARNLALIGWARDRLAEHDVKLLVAMVPAKARVYPEHIGRRQPAALHRDLYERLRMELWAADIPSADLLTMLTLGKSQSPTFLRTDTHWTPHGARLAATTIAAAVQAGGLGSTDAPTQFRTQTDAPRLHRGDLFNFLPLDPYFSRLLPPPDSVETASTEKDGGGSDLLGDAGAPKVALVGTSYSAEPRWNFQGALQEVLHEEVSNYARLGVGPYAPLFAYLQSEDFRTAPPRLVIWELPERYLLMRQQLDEFHLPPEAYVARAASTRS